MARLSGWRLRLRASMFFATPILIGEQSVLILANEIDRHVALPASSAEPVEKHPDHLLVRVRDDVERTIFLPHERDQETGREGPEG